MTTTHFIAILAMGLVVSMCSSVSAERFTLADGSTRAVIALPAKPSEAESLAASEIARYVELVGGAKLGAGWARTS